MNHKLKKIVEDNDGYIRIKVLPNSSKNEITEILGNETVKIRITAAPEKGKANKELTAFLSEILETSKEDITIISGKTDQLKLIKINTTSSVSY